MPVDLEASPDGRLFVVERVGTIRQLLAKEVALEPYLDVSDQVSIEAGEQGLLGLAFHPDFIDNRSLFVSYTNLDGDLVIARFYESTASSKGILSRQETILTIAQPYPNHNGGHLIFGPDGMLYLGLGDGGSAGDPNNHAQRLDSLLGKILRLDVDRGNPYAIPVDNPFANQAEARAEIWDYGLRNPWRFHFDQTTGDLYIADVGQQEREELNFEPAGSGGGLNYGWNYWEGSLRYRPGGQTMVEPIDEYDHSQGCAITGGPVIHDSRLPEWDGVVFYGDACSGRIWGLRKDSFGNWQGGLLYNTDFHITTFGVDSEGRILLADYHDEQGAIYRLEPR